VAPRVDTYEFGRIVVDGVEYRADLIILPDGVAPDWWRREGHSLAPEDLPAATAAAVATLVVGTGAYGAMAVPAATVAFLAERDIALEAKPTAAAVERYNALAAAGERVAAALHLTC
jgi:hypothetical protein